MANRFQRGRSGHRDDVQNKGVHSMPGKAGVAVPNDGRVSVEVLDARPLLLHNAHLQSGKEPAAGCIFCGAVVAAPSMVVKVRVSPSAVDPGGGADKADAATPARDSEFWPWERSPGTL